MKSAAKLLLLLGLSSLPMAHSARAAAPGPFADVTRQTLPNGLRVLVKPRHSSPVVTTMMWYRVGSRDEVPGSTGIAHFLEHLMFKGTQKLGKGAIDRITYQNGGSNNAFTSYDYTAYEFNLPRQNWKTALEIEADRMRNCSFNRQEFDAERQVVMEERRGNQDDPAQEFGEQLNAVSYLSHPYRNPVIGWMEDIQRLSRDEVFAFYRKYYVPSNCTLVITGDVTPAEALAAAQQAFAAVPKLPAPRRPEVKEPPQIAERRLRVALDTGVPRLELVFPIPNRRSPDAYALHILGYALGEGKLSRLYQRLVDGDHAAASVDTGVTVNRDGGQFTFDADAREDVPLETLEQSIHQEIERVVRAPLSDAELARAKNQFYSDWIHGLTTARALAGALGEADALGGYEYLNSVLARTDAVTAADVQRVAKSYLQAGLGTVGYLLPREKAAGGGKRPAASGKRPMGATLRGGAVLPARAPRAYRTQPAAPASVKAVPTAPAAGFQELHTTEKVLSNGLRLILLENHDVPSVTFSARVDAGSYQDTDANSGLANLTARMLDEGTTKHTDRQVAEALEGVGAAFSASAGRMTTTMDLQTLSRYADGLAPLFAELIRTPAFAADRLAQERSRVLVALKEEADDAGAIARKTFYEAVYTGHPAHRPVGGSATTVEKLEAADLEAFHSRYYRPENTTLVAVGDFRTEALLARLTSIFGDWERGSTPAAAPYPPLRRQTAVQVQRIEMDKTQTQVLLGHLGVSRRNPDYTALRVMDTILGEGVGGGFTARIPYQIRDIQGLAYTVGSSITDTAGREPGVFVASLGTEPKKANAAVAGVLAVIRKFRSAPVSPEELKDAENYLASSYVFDFQTQEQLAAYLQDVQFYGLPIDFRQQFMRDVRRVSRDEVLRVARKYLDPDHYTLVVVGPEPAKK